MMADTEAIEQLDTVDNAGSIYRKNFTSVSIQQETETQMQTATKRESTHFSIKCGQIIVTVDKKEPAQVFQGLRKFEDNPGETFRNFDINHDDGIEADEIKTRFKRMLIKSESVIETTFNEEDKNHDGRLSRSEFKKFISNFIAKLAAKLNYKTIPNIVFKKEMPWSMVILSVVLVLLYWCNSKNPDLVEFLKLYPCLNNGEIWRLLTYMLVHADMIHLIHNIIIQILSGFCFLEANNKRYQVYIIYFTGVILGGLGHIIFSDNNLVGCSGGVYALIGAIVSYILLNFRNLQQTQHGYCVLSIVLIFLGYEYMSPHTNTSHPAHIFGGISGLLLGFSILENKEELDWEEKLILLAKILFGILVFDLIFLVVMKNYGCCPGGCNEKWIHH